MNTNKDIQEKAQAALSEDLPPLTLLEAAQDLLTWIEAKHRPPKHDVCGTMALVRLDALATLADAVAAATRQPAPVASTPAMARMPLYIKLAPEMRAAGEEARQKARDDGCASIKVLEAVFFEAAIQRWLDDRLDEEYEAATAASQPVTDAKAFRIEMKKEFGQTVITCNRPGSITWLAMENGCAIEFEPAAVSSKTDSERDAALTLETLLACAQQAGLGKFWLDGDKMPRSDGYLIGQDFFTRLHERIVAQQREKD